MYLTRQLPRAVLWPMLVGVMLMGAPWVHGDDAYDDFPLIGSFTGQPAEPVCS